MSPRALRVALALAGILALSGVAARILPPWLPSVEVSAAEPDRVREPPSGGEQAATLLSYHAIVAADPFSPERTAPGERYTPPELRSAAAAPDPDAAAPAADPEPAPAFRPRLVGTAVGPQGSVALIDADPAIPGAEVFRVGDRIGSSRVTDILDTAVILDGPDGRITLTLPSSIRR